MIFGELWFHGLKRMLNR